MTKKYEEVAERISSWILDSAFDAGDRLPSIRSLSETLNVSVSTIITALRWLESEGLVEARNRSGFYVSSQTKKRPQESVAGETTSAHDRNQSQERDHLKLALNHKDAVLLGSATPSDQYLPLRQIQKSLLRASRRASHSLGFSFPGDPDYLSAIGKRMTTIGVTATGSDIISTGGAQEALTLALRAILREGDQAAVFVPASPGILQAMRAMGASIIEVPSEPDGTPSLESLETLADRLDIKVLCLSANVSNPTGYTLSSEEKSKLLAVAEAHGFTVIEDDVYGDLHWGSKRPLPLKAYDKSDSVIYCGSFSKTVSSGLRTGWIMPGRFYGAVSDQKYFMNFSSPSVTQVAVADYLSNGAHDLYLRKIREIYRANLQRIRDFVVSQFPKGTHCSDPSGGFSLWLTLPERLNATELYPAAKDSGFCYAPGQLFSGEGNFANCLRLSGTRPVDEQFQTGLKFLANLFHRALSEHQPRSA